MDKIGIIGGAGAIGQVVTDLFGSLDYEPVISDPALPESHTVDALLDECRLLYISVFPLELIPEILAKVAAHPNVSEFVVLENSSVKEVIGPAFLQLDRLGASVYLVGDIATAGFQHPEDVSPDYLV